MSLVDRLSNVEIKLDTRISDEDRIYCKTNQKAYREADSEGKFHIRWGEQKIS